MKTDRSSSDRRWRNRNLVRERDERLARWLWGMLVSLVVALAPAGVYLLCQNECLRVSYEVSAIRAEHEHLLEEERALKVERAGLESPPRIEAWARHDPGLALPDPENVLIVIEATPDSVDLVARRSESSRASSRR